MDLASNTTISAVAYQLDIVNILIPNGHGTTNQFIKVIVSGFFSNFLLCVRQ